MSIVSTPAIVRVATSRQNVRSTAHSAGQFQALEFRDGGSVVFVISPAYGGASESPHRRQQRRTTAVSLGRRVLSDRPSRLDGYRKPSILEGLHPYRHKAPGGKSSRVPSTPKCSPTLRTSCHGNRMHFAGMPQALLFLTLTSTTSPSWHMRQP